MDSCPIGPTCGLCIAVEIRELDEEKARLLLPVKYTVVALAWIVPTILALAFSDPKWLLMWSVSLILSLVIYLTHLDRVESTDIF